MPNPSGSMPSGAITFPILDAGAARAAVQERATELIERALEAFPRWSPPPFDPRVFAQVLGIDVIATDTPSHWDALFIPTGEQPQIILNTAVPSLTRQNFTLAHEIAHSWFEDPGHTAFFMRSREKEKYQRDESARQLERLCDLGAAELLMPGKWLDPMLQREGFRAHTVASVAQEFFVSFEAAALRIMDEQDEPCAIGFFELAGQPSFEMKAPSMGTSPKKTASGRPRSPREQRVAYRARRVFRSDGFPFLFPHGKSVPDESVIYRTSLKSGEAAAVEEFSLGKSRQRLSVSAFALHRDGSLDAPPLVCAAFQMS